MSCETRASRSVVTLLMTTLVCFAGCREQKTGDVLIENVTLIDGTGAAPLPNASVLIKGDRIALVSPVPLKHSGGVTVVDGEGKYLIPGLIDTHIHLAGGHVMKNGQESTDRALGIEALQGYLYSGVTSVYDSGNNPDFIFALRDDERAGRIVSPRLFAAGSVVAFTGGYGAGPGSINFTDWAAGRPLLEAYLRRKPDLLKIIVHGSGPLTQPDAPGPRFSVETLHEITHFANSHGVRTTAHVSLGSDAWISINGGIDEMAHPLRRADADDDYFNLVATRQIPICTTTAVFVYIAQIGDDPSFLDAPPYKATIDAKTLAGLKAERERYISSGMAPAFKSSNPQMERNIKRLFDRGALLALGTDRTWGPTVQLELATLHESGIPLFDLIKIATLNAAIYLGQERNLGSIERGKLADLLLLRADPTQDVKNFQQIDAVYKGGREINLAALDLPANHH